MHTDENMVKMGGWLTEVSDGVPMEFANQRCQQTYEHDH